MENDLQEFQDLMQSNSTKKKQNSGIKLFKGKQNNYSNVALCDGVGWDGVKQSLLYAK